MISSLLSWTRSYPQIALNINAAPQAYQKVIFIKTNPPALGGCKRAGGLCLHFLPHN